MAGAADLENSAESAEHDESKMIPSSSEVSGGEDGSSALGKQLAELGRACVDLRQAAGEVTSVKRQLLTIIKLMSTRDEKICDGLSVYLRECGGLASVLKCLQGDICTREVFHILALCVGNAHNADACGQLLDGVAIKQVASILSSSSDSRMLSLSLIHI